MKVPMVPGFGELTSEKVMTGVEQVIYRHSTVDYTKSEKATREQAKVYLSENVCVSLLRVIKMIQMVYIFEKNIDRWEPVREPHPFDKAFLDPSTQYPATHAHRRGLFNTIDDLLVMDTVITLIKKLLEYNLITRDHYRSLPYKTLSLSQIEEDDICPICHMEFGDGDQKCNNPIELRCAGKRRGHKFGFECIKEWRTSILRTDGHTYVSCPTCRRRVKGGRTIDWPWEQQQIQVKHPETPAWVELLIPDVLRNMEESD
ncbi:RING/U-box [Glarea lozoyensis ATCC 20868]|uniref:RING/U-box n=1 Tax=Glarea lozoyensis (strain ATCC 20868 / MF5171) TaxID=1116229 RepID=S3DC73_GLAL2|nr:RING/U-box [Glarea lozoyensis ATCC 20868]EPE29606.1 RING/U-box [Glarea lozoyensis ATCC 20868]